PQPLSSKPADCHDQIPAPFHRKRRRSRDLLFYVCWLRAGLDRDYPVVTTHKFGAGTAIYIGLPAREELLDAVIGETIKQLAIKTGPEVPAGVMARQINATHILYLNLDGTAKRVELKGHSRSILLDREYDDGFSLGPYEPEFVETR
ncbi:MAG: hypothetical protein ABSE90_09500, partial [Verrucomicrobiota bacterium]